MPRDRLFRCWRSAASRRDNPRGFRWPPWSSSPRRCAGWRRSESLLFSFRRGLVADQALARLDVGELHRLVAGLGEIGAVVGAARVLAFEGGERDDAAHFAQRAQIEPVLPGQIEAAVIL